MAMIVWILGDPDGLAFWTETQMGLVSGALGASLHCTHLMKASHVLR